MRFKQSLTVVAFTVAAVAATSFGVLAPTAQAAIMTVPLPITHYFDMLVDPAHQHLFIASGPGSSSILVTDYAGQTVATIPNEPGATDFALSTDGSTVYAALFNGDAVSAISTSTLAETGRYATGTGTEPTYVTYSSGKIWFGYGAAARGGVGSIDPSTSPATVTMNAAAGYWYAAPLVTATPGGELVVGEDQSPAQLASYDVSSGTATVLAPEKYLYSADGYAVGGLNSLQITPDGKDVVLATGSPYYHLVYRVSDLSADGTYPTTTYPNSVSISGDGSVAAGTCCGTGTNEIFMFAAGGSIPLNTYSFGLDWLANDGAALTPDGSELFAVTTAGGPTGAPMLNIIPNPEQAPTITAVTCQKVKPVLDKCTATVSDTSPGTRPTGTVSFTSSGPGVFSATQCTLSGSGTSASCAVYYAMAAGVPFKGKTITATYGGDRTHQSSTGSTTLT